MANEYDDKMLELRKSVPQAGDGTAPKPRTKPTPAYQVRSVHPKQEFALIETETQYGAPASDPTMRKIQIGDELPEGSVTAITPEGIKVIPPVEGDEFVIPFGKREGYAPATPKKTKPEKLYDYKNIRASLDHMKAMTSSFLTPKPINYQANQQGLVIGPKVIDDHGIEVAEDPDAIEAIADQHAAQYIYKDVPEDDIPQAAAIDYEREQAADSREETYSGFGPGNDGAVYFYEMTDGGGQRGFWVREDGSVSNVTGILFPPSVGEG